MYKKFEKGMAPNNCQYPMTQRQIDNLEGCRLVNPKSGKHYNYKVPEDFDLDLKAEEVLKVRNDVEAGKFPHWFMEKYYPFKSEFGNYEFPAEIFQIEGLTESDPKELANVVHMDSPTDMPRMALKWLTHPNYNQRANVKGHTSKYINFLETIPYT